MASLIFNLKLVEAESRILKQSAEQRGRQFSEPLKCCGNACRRREVHGCEWQNVYWFHQYKRVSNRFGGMRDLAFFHGDIRDLS